MDAVMKLTFKEQAKQLIPEGVGVEHVKIEFEDLNGQRYELIVEPVKSDGNTHIEIVMNTEGHSCTLESVWIEAQE